MELNQKAAEMRSEWHKIAAILMVKFKQTSVDITIEDIDALMTCGTSNIVFKPDGDKLRVFLVDDVTALRLSEEKNS